MAPAIIGVDPGLKGAITALIPPHNIVFIVDMPTVEFQVGKTKRRKLDIGALIEIFVFCDLWEVSEIVIEDVSAHPDQGVVSMFSFGDGFGAVRALAHAALKREPKLVSPAIWKPRMGVPGKKGSKGVKGAHAAIDARACEEFPGCGHMWRGPRGGLMDGRAESALLAKYGAKYVLKKTYASL